jgi:adenylate cyclase
VSADVIDEVRRRIWWVGWLGNGLGILVVFATVGLLAEIYFDPEIPSSYWVRVTIVMTAYFVIVGLTITRVTRRRIFEAYAWYSENREPSEREHRLALGHAVYQTFCSALGWTFGGVLFIALSIDQPFAYIAAGSAASMLGAETTLAIIYLLSERALRPLTALALGARPVTHPVAPSVRTRLYFAWSLGTGVPLLGLLIVGASALFASGLDTDKVAATVVFLSVVAMLVGWLVTAIASRAIADPLTQIREAVDRVAKGDLEVQVAIDDASEVGLRGGCQPDGRGPARPRTHPRPIRSLGR